MKDRIKPLEGVNNFRDFGGYEGARNARVQPGRLFRSGHFGEASEKDLAELDNFAISVQADLRRPDERERHGDKWPVRGVRRLYSDKGREADAPHINFLRHVAADGEAAKNWMRDYYIEAPYRPALVETYTAWFDHLVQLEEGEAALVNCAAGKDRTGILCALTHHTLGVSKDDIFTDYELTNSAADVESRLPLAREYFNDMLGKNYDDEVFRPFLGVERQFLEAAIAAIESESGSIDAYLDTVLGVDAARRDLIREKLLA